MVVMSRWGFRKAAGTPRAFVMPTDKNRIGRILLLVGKHVMNRCPVLWGNYSVLDFVSSQPGKVLDGGTVWFRLACEDVRFEEEYLDAG
jgi:hypothetical protein